jgi:cellulose synthase/poly-beta-1,6-N-acetylglucosamine synthase-like glycosyltransferase
MTAFVLLFWTAVGLSIYTYFAYPILLFAITSFRQSLRDIRFTMRLNNRRQEILRDTDLPSISVVISAYNEEASIAAKIENALELDYPKDKLEILVGSDGSDDKTNLIVASYADRGVILAAYPERRGKPSVLNDTIARATGDILILSDATTMLDKNVPRSFVRHFRDPHVGAVNGYMTYISHNGEQKQEGVYWIYEEALKFMESKLGVVLGATGPMYAIRRSSYQPISPNCVVDDFVIPLKIMSAGYRTAYDTEARATEEAASDIEGEAARRIRIGAGNFQALTMTYELLNPLRGWVAWCYLSHKIFKWLTWLMMATAFVANLFLLHRPLYQVTAILQLIFYGMAIAGACRLRVPILGKLCSLVYYFVSMHVALFRGFVRWIKHSQAITWSRSYR